MALCGHIDGAGYDWGLPKGTPEPGETRTETAIREVTGGDRIWKSSSTTTLARLKYTFPWPNDGLRVEEPDNKQVIGHKTVLFYLMSATGGSTDLHDHEFDDVQWFPADTALRSLRYENEAGIVKMASRWHRRSSMTAVPTARGARSVLLREKRLEDAENDYSWRVDEELARHDATRPLRMSFREFRKYSREELEYPSPWSRRFAVETLDGRHIGNCMYYDIDTRRGETELGIVIGDKDYLGKGYGTDAVDSLLDHIFTTTTIAKVYLHTLDWNQRARKSFAKSGFNEVRPVRRSGLDFIRMEILQGEWKQLRGQENRP